MVDNEEFLHEVPDLPLSKASQKLREEEAEKIRQEYIKGTNRLPLLQKKPSSNDGGSNPA